MSDSTTAYIIEQEIQSEKRDTLRELISKSECQSSANELVSLNTVHTASLFVRCEEEKQNALVWYLEVESEVNTEFHNPESIVRELRLFEAEFAELLEFPDEARVYAEGAENGLLVHETHPERNAFSSGDDVVLIRLDIRSGFGTWVMRQVARVIWWLDGGRIAQRLQNASREVMEEEGMLTETIFVDKRDDELSLLWYMESEGQEQVIDAYYDTSNLVARISEVVLGIVLERPEELLGNPHTYTNHELLAHATNPNRV